MPDVIEWVEPSRDTLLHRYPVDNRSIVSGSRLVTREGQAALFVNEGVLSEVFGPGSYELTTNHHMFKSFIDSAKFLRLSYRETSSSSSLGCSPSRNGAPRIPSC